MTSTFRYGCLDGSRVHVHLSNVGEDDSGPTKAIAAAEAKKELGAVMTSSPAPTPWSAGQDATNRFHSRHRCEWRTMVCEFTLKSTHSDLGCIAPSRVLRQMPHEDPHGLQRSGHENPCKEPQKCSLTLSHRPDIAGMPISGNGNVIWKVTRVRAQGPKVGFVSGPAN